MGILWGFPQVFSVGMGIKIQSPWQPCGFVNNNADYIRTLVEQYRQHHRSIRVHAIDDVLFTRELEDGGVM